VHYPIPCALQVVTLVYRAPEILLGSTEYHQARRHHRQTGLQRVPPADTTYGRVRPVPVQGVDIWSVGCIFAEMVKGEVTAAALHRVCVGTLSALGLDHAASAVLCHVRCVFAASGLVRRRF
jgi:hypothetical protein